MIMSTSTPRGNYRDHETLHDRAGDEQRPILASEGEGNVD